MKKPRKLTVSQIQTINQLTSEGINGNQIAKRLGISPSVARYHMKKIKSPNLLPKSKDVNFLDAFNSYKKEMDKLKLKFVETIMESL